MYLLNLMNQSLSKLSEEVEPYRERNRQALEALKRCVKSMKEDLAGMEAMQRLIDKRRKEVAEWHDLRRKTP